MFVRYCKCSQLISFSLISSSHLPCSLSSTLSPWGFLLSLSCIPFFFYLVFVPKYNFLPKDATSGPYPFLKDSGDDSMGTREMASMENVLCTWRITQESFSILVRKLVPSLIGSFMLFAKLWMFCWECRGPTMRWDLAENTRPLSSEGSTHPDLWCHLWAFCYHPDAGMWDSLSLLCYILTQPAKPLPNSERTNSESSWGLSHAWPVLGVAH